MTLESSQPIDLSQYRQALRDHIRSIVRNPTEAEDVLQEVLVKAHQNLGQLREELTGNPEYTRRVRRLIPFVY